MIVTCIYSMLFFKEIHCSFIAIRRMAYKLVIKRGSVNKNIRSRGFKKNSCAFELCMKIQQLTKTKMSKYVVGFILL